MKYLLSLWAIFVLCSCGQSRIDPAKIGSELTEIEQIIDPQLTNDLVLKVDGSEVKIDIPSAAANSQQGFTEPVITPTHYLNVSVSSKLKEEIINTPEPSSNDLPREEGAYQCLLARGDFLVHENLEYHHIYKQVEGQSFDGVIIYPTVTALIQKGVKVYDASNVYESRRIQVTLSLSDLMDSEGNLKKGKISIRTKHANTEVKRGTKSLQVSINLQGARLCDLHDEACKPKPVITIVPQLNLGENQSHDDSTIPLTCPGYEQSTTL